MIRASKRLPQMLLVISLAVLALVAGALAWRVLDQRAVSGLEVLTVLPKPRVIEDFALQDQTGAAFSIDRFRGRWSVLFFGFTSCPDVCPDTLYQLQQVHGKLREHLNPERVPAVYLVSVDPERDSPEKLAEYLAHFDPSFIGLTGSDEQLRALTTQLGIMYHIEPHDPGVRDYAVDHSASLLLLDPQARLHGVLTAPHNAERIASDLRTVLDRG